MKKGFWIPVFFTLLAALPVQAAEFTASTVAELRQDITSANDEAVNPGADTINLAAKTTYTLNSVDNTDGFGANGLPQITSLITIKGNGAILERDASGPKFRIFSITSSGNLTLNNLVIRGGDSDAGKHGGAVFISMGQSGLTDVTLTSNKSGGGGGAIANLGGTLTVKTSTLSSNSNASSDGGAIYNTDANGAASSATIQNSTISGNTGAGNGGAIFNDASVANCTASVTNSTIASNTSVSGGAIGATAGVTIKNSIVANNTSNNNPANCSQALTSNGGNMESGNSCGLNPQLGDKIDTDPKLAALADNGGPTQTHALSSGSPAIDAGDNATCVNDLPKDQRGVSRLKVCDIGAYEYSCGNNLVEKGEQCDDSAGCCDQTKCTFKAKAITCDDNLASTVDDQCDGGGKCVGRVPACGDGFKDAGEECDDGPNNSNSKADACRTSCKKASCSDGVKDSGEECDDGNKTDTDSCTNACKNAVCGDGIAGPNEECDDGNKTDTDSCTNACKNAVCGDGIAGPNEECDDSNKTDTDSCTNACKNAVCGDGIAGPNEQCDDGANNSDSKADACRTGCKKASCGDKVVDGGEECDDGNVADGDGCNSLCKNEPAGKPGGESNASPAASTSGGGCNLIHQ